MAEPFVIEVTTVGRVELHGTGPWEVHEYGRGSYEIVDSKRAPARPTVWHKYPGGRKDQSVIWAQKSVPSMIVKEANAALAKGA